MIDFLMNWYCKYQIQSLQWKRIYCIDRKFSKRSFHTVLHMNINDDRLTLIQ